MRMEPRCRYALIGEALAKSIESFIRGRDKEDPILKEMFIRLEEQIRNKEIDPPEITCDYCMTFLETWEIVRGYLFEDQNLNWVIEMEHHVKKARARGKIFQNIAWLSPEDFNRSPFIANKRRLVYLDHNVMNKIHKDKEIKRRLASGYADIQYVYSPSHLQEIIRMNDNDEESKVISSIREVTSSLFISNFTGIDLTPAYEDPDYGIKRISNGKAAQDVEAYRLITINDRKIFYPDHVEENYTRKLTFNYIYNHESIKAVADQFPVEDIIDESGKVKNFIAVHQAIHALSRALDNIGYKADKTKRTIKSGVHDIEHMIYAAGTQIFVTYDDTLKERSEFIYKRLGIQTTVTKWEVYADYLDCLADRKSRDFEKHIP